MLAITRQPQLLGNGGLGEFGLAAYVKEVATLQQALKDLSVAAKYPAGDPGAVDGKAGKNTAMALLAWVDQLVAKIPGLSSVKTYLPAVMSLGWDNADDTVRNFVLDYIYNNAAKLTVAVNAIKAGYGGGGSGGPPAPGAAWPSGTVYRYNTTTKMYVHYAPLGWSGLGISTLGDSGCIYGDCQGLGDPPVTPAQPAGTKPGVPLTTPAPGATNAGTEQNVSDSIFTKWWFWTAIGGGVLVLGGGAYMLLKK